MHDTSNNCIEVQHILTVPCNSFFAWNTTPPDSKEHNDVYVRISGIIIYLHNPSIQSLYSFMKWYVAVYLNVWLPLLCTKIYRGEN